MDNPFALLGIVIGALAGAFCVLVSCECFCRKCLLRNAPSLPYEEPMGLQLQEDVEFGRRSRSVSSASSAASDAAVVPVNAVVLGQAARVYTYSAAGKVLNGGRHM